MAGVLEALIVREEFAEYPVVDLNQGWALLPLTDALHVELGDDERPFPDAERLTRGIIQLAERASAPGTSVYVHSEFHGGTGFQAAACWSEGAMSCKPLLTANHPTEALTENYEVVGKSQDMAINRALRLVGVTNDGSGDEYAAIGLERFRWTDEWALRL